eukprot:Sspe_Gene.95295::Locus_67598_Transcript_3_3_Confidence_0.600_Length_1307::g.95295::m.95295
MSLLTEADELELEKMLEEQGLSDGKTGAAGRSRRASWDKEDSGMLGASPSHTKPRSSPFDDDSSPPRKSPFDDDTAAPPQRKSSPFDERTAHRPSQDNKPPSKHSFDDSSSGGEEETGSVTAIQPDGTSLRFKGFADAGQSSRLAKGSTILVPPGVHKWPGGDLYHSIRGCGAEKCVITGNEGGGYFFYVRRSGVAIEGVTLRGVRGRCHVYIDQLSAVTVKASTLEAEKYNHAVQVVSSSSNVVITGCRMKGTTQPAVHVSINCRNVDVRNNVFTVCSSPHIAFHDSGGSTSGNVAEDGVLRVHATDPSLVKIAP